MEMLDEKGKVIPESVLILIIMEDTHGEDCLHSKLFQNYKS